MHAHTHTSTCSHAADAWGYAPYACHAAHAYQLCAAHTSARTSYALHAYQPCIKRTTRSQARTHHEQQQPHHTYSLALGLTPHSKRHTQPLANPPTLAHTTTRRHHSLAPSSWPPRAPRPPPPRIASYGHIHRAPNVPQSAPSQQGLVRRAGRGGLRPLASAAAQHLAASLVNQLHCAPPSLHCAPWRRTRQRRVCCNPTPLRGPTAPCLPGAHPPHNGRGHKEDDAPEEQRASEHTATNRTARRQRWVSTAGSADQRGLEPSFGGSSQKPPRERSNA